MKKNKININSNGFTLIELLVTIFLIGIVMTLSVVTISTGIKKSKEKSLKVAKNSLLSSGNNYVKETYTEKNWDWVKDETNEDESNKVLFTCVSVDQLISKGYLDKDFKTKNEKLKDINFIYYEKNSEKNIITKSVFPKNMEPYDRDCRKLVEKAIITTTPNFKGEIIKIEPEPIPEPEPEPIPEPEPEPIPEPEPVPKESVPNAPDLSTGLIPVVYTNNNWVVADINSNWYDYDKQEWANGISVSSTYRGNYINSDGSYNAGTIVSMSHVLAMFVWIPRYSYTIGCLDGSSCLGYVYGNGSYTLSTTYPGAIDIKFEQGTESETLTGTYPRYTYYSSNTDEVRKSLRETHWYTHPAFTFGSQELTGIWVGKFEMTGSTTTPTIIPNAYALTGKSMKTYFDTVRKFSTTSTYGLTGDAHMMKNEEWAVVSYLFQSKYGKYGNQDYWANYKEIYNNNSSNLVTGRSIGGLGTVYSASGTCEYNNITIRANGLGACGAGASTTGTIYGVYDMVGGASEFLMGNYQRQASVKVGFIIYTDNNKSGFDDTWMKTASNYKYYTYFSNKLSSSSSMIGHALQEVNNWYSDALAYDGESGMGDFDNLQRWLSRGNKYNSSNIGIFRSSARANTSTTYDSYSTTRAVLVNK